MAEVFDYGQNCDVTVDVEKMDITEHCKQRCPRTRELPAVAIREAMYASETAAIQCDTYGRFACNAVITFPLLGEPALAALEVEIK